MKALLRVADPDTVEFTLTVTMSLDDWKALRSQLNHNWPSWELSQAIYSMVHKAERAFHPEVDE